MVFLWFCSCFPEANLTVTHETMEKPCTPHRLPRAGFEGDLSVGCRVLNGLREKYLYKHSIVSGDIYVYVNVIYIYIHIISQ